MEQQEVQLAHYKLANPDAMRVHTSLAREVAVVGGNRSSKTDTMLAELAIQMTGHIPKSLESVYPREKIRAPIRARVVCNSLTATFDPIIKPKLRWDQWNGVGEPGSGLGHYGWIPRHCLVGGKWETAWSERTRTLHVLVDNYWTDSNGYRWGTSGVSTCQFMSYDQDLSAFPGSSLHVVQHDEIPPADIYRENRMRTLDVRGQMYTAFTPPDDPGMSMGDVGWFYENVYEPGLPGPGQNPSVESITIHTERNQFLSVEAIAELSARLTPEQREVRLHGAFIHMSGLVYPSFTTYDATWCFQCHKKVLPKQGKCATCGKPDLNTFCHVEPAWPVPKSWPIIMAIDPHPRKKDAVGWFAISPTDDVYMVGELEQEGTALDVVREIRRMEERHRWEVRRRVMDANIATQTNDKMQRGWTMRKAYDDAGLRCDLSVDDVNYGIQRVTDYLRPDPMTRRPRLVIHDSCPRTIYGMTHWLWGDWARNSGDKEVKETPRDRHKDFPDLVRYALMSNPSFRGLRMDRGLIHTMR